MLDELSQLGTLVLSYVLAAAFVLVYHSANLAIIPDGR